MSTPISYEDLLEELERWAPPSLYKEPDKQNAPDSYVRTRGIGCEQCLFFVTKLGSSLTGRGRCSKYSFDTSRGFTCADVRLE